MASQSVSNETYTRAQKRALHNVAKLFEKYAEFSAAKGDGRSEHAWRFTVKQIQEVAEGGPAMLQGKMDCADTAIQEKDVSYILDS